MFVFEHVYTTQWIVRVPTIGTGLKDFVVC